MIVRALVFDLDGTLLDTLADLAHACNTVLEKHGLPVHPTKSYRYFVGNGFRTLVNRVLPTERTFTDEEMEQLLAEARAVYARDMYRETRPYPGIPELLDALAKRGLRLCVLSNKPDAATVPLVEHFFPGVFHIVRGHLQGVPLKPDPTPLLNLLETAGVARDEVLYVGDTSVDMLTSSRAGTTGVGVTWGFRDREELAESGADVIVDTPPEILSLVEQSSPQSAPPRGRS